MDLNQGPSAYLPNALLLGQTSSLCIRKTLCACKDIYKQLKSLQAVKTFTNRCTIDANPFEVCICPFFIPCAFMSENNSIHHHRHK